MSNRRLILVALFALAPAALAQAWSATIFDSGIRRVSQPEDSGYSYHQVTSWEGAAGIGVARRVTRHLSVETTLELRRDVVLSTYGGRLCGPYHNTCFATHRIGITSMPLTVAAHASPFRIGNVTPFATVAVRYVPEPRVRDLTRSDFFGHRFEVAVSPRISIESGAGVSIALCGRLDLFGEVRHIFRDGADWDPRRKLIVGLGYAW